MPPDTELRLGSLGAPLRLETARHNGYAALIERAPGDGTNDPDVAQDKYLATLSPADLDRYSKLLDPEDSPQARINLHSGAAVAAISAATTGCAAQARERLYGSVEAFLHIHNFPNELTGRGTEVRQHERVENAVASYRTCMSKAGYEVIDTADARFQANERFGGTLTLSDPISEAERSMAVTDARCQAASGINTAMEDAFIDVMSTWLHDHQDRIVWLHEQMDEAVTQAHIVLSQL